MRDQTKPNHYTAEFKEFECCVNIYSEKSYNVIAVFDINGKGRLVYRASFDPGGEWPRHFAFSGEHLIVGNEHSHKIDVFNISDVLSIKPGEKSDEVQQLAHASAMVTSPACIAI